MTDNEKIIELLTEIRDSLKKPEKKVVKRFIKPTYIEVARYCINNNFKTEAQTFIDFYDSKDWVVGKAKMKDWKAAIRTWEKRNGSSGQGQNTGFDKSSRAKKVSDKLRELGEKDINDNGFTDSLGSRTV
mgnify:CR=1 FL=1